MDQKTPNEKPKRTKPQGQRKKKRVIQSKKKINPWKVAFISLVAVLIGGVWFLAMRINQPREDESNLVKTEMVAGESIVTINTQKEQLNQLIDHFLNEFLENSEVKYDFYLKNEALLTGEFAFFDHPLQFYLYFDPYVMEDGNVLLKAKSLSLGSLNLPISDLLGMIKRSYEFPEWVEVNTEEKTITLKLNEFKMATGLFIRAEKINLIDDEIRFSLYYPEKNAADNSTADSSTAKSSKGDT